MSEYEKRARFYQACGLIASFAGLLSAIFVGSYIKLFSVTIGVGVLISVIYQNECNYSKKKAQLTQGITIAIFIISALYFGIKYPSDCYIDWEGRSNPTVCD